MKPTGTQGSRTFATPAVCALGVVFLTACAGSVGPVSPAEAHAAITSSQPAPSSDETATATAPAATATAPATTATAPAAISTAPAATATATTATATATAPAAKALDQLKNSDGWTFKVPQGVPKVDADQAIKSARSCGVRHEAFTQKGAPIVTVLVLLNIHGPRGQEDTDSPFMLKDRLVYVVQASDVEIAYSSPTMRTEPLVARSVVQFAIDAVTGECLKVRDFGTVGE